MISAGLVLGHASSGHILMVAGRFASSRSHLEEGHALYDPISHCSLGYRVGIDPHLYSQAVLAIALLCLGFPDQALAQCSAAIAESRRVGHPPSLALSLSIGCRLLSLFGDNAALRERADEMVDLATERGLPFWRALGAMYRGYSKVKNGDVAEGKALLRSGLSAYHASTGAVLWLPYYTALLAEASEIGGQIDEAVAQLDDALQIVDRTKERWFAAELNRHKGQLLLRHGQVEAAEEDYRKALSVAVDQEAKLWELRAAVSLARLRRDQGRRPEARELLAPVYGRFTEGFDTPDRKGAARRACLICLVAFCLRCTGNFIEVRRRRWCCRGVTSGALLRRFDLMLSWSPTPRSSRAKVSLLAHRN